MRIGVIGPSEREIMPFINKIEDRKIKEHAMLKFYLGTYKGVEIVAVFCGVCKVNAAIATQLLIEKFKTTHIILTGVAGALNNKLQVGDIVISSEVGYHDVATGILTKYHPRMKDIYFRADEMLLKLSENVAKSLLFKGKWYVGRIITGETFITHNEREYLIEKFNPLCVDMESGSVAHTCYVNNIPFVFIRSMSDSADENGSKSFENNVETASLNAINLVEGIIEKLSLVK